MGTIVIPTCLVRKLRHLEGKVFTLGHIAAKWCCQALNLGTWSLCS